MTLTTSVCIDVGNAFTKATSFSLGDSSYNDAIAENYTILPSLIAEYAGDPLDLPEECTLISYLGGDYESLTDTHWLVGSDAQYQRAASSSIAQASHHSGKPKYCLLFIAKTIKKMAGNEARHYVKVFTSVPSTKILGEEMKNSLRGNHELLVGNQKLHLFIEEVEVTNEGLPSLWLAQHKQIIPETSSEAVVLDIGGGTADLSFLSWKGKWQEDTTARAILDRGVMRLVDEIVSSSASPMRNMAWVDQYKVMEAIERQDYKYQERDEYDFSKLYYEQKRVWAKYLFQDAESKAERAWKIPDLFLFTGGGTALIRELIQQVNSNSSTEYIALPTPQTANLQGLCLRGIQWLKKQGNRKAEATEAEPMSDSDFSSFLKDLESQDGASTKTKNGG